MPLDISKQTTLVTFSNFQVTVEELTFASTGRKNKKEAKKGVAMEALSTLYNVVYPPGSNSQAEKIFPFINFSLV